MTVASLSFSLLSCRAKRAICICLVTLVSPLVAQQLPTGWRRPSAAETSSDWRKKTPTKFLLVKGDFDADGKPDIAELLVNPAANQFAFFVTLASTGKWQLVDKPIDLKDLDHFGIDLVKPGKYETACGKGYGDYACAHGEPDFLKLSVPAIDFFYTESSDSIYYWDPKAAKFVEVLMSD